MEITEVEVEVEVGVEVKVQEIKEVDPPGIAIVITLECMGILPVDNRGLR